MVDRFGHRFVNEAANYNDMQKAFFAFDANDAAPRHLPCWVVFDKQYRDRYPVLTVRPGAPDPEWLLAHDTLEGLAAAAGLDPVGLAAPVSAILLHTAWAREIGRAPVRQRVWQ